MFKQLITDVQKSHPDGNLGRVVIHHPNLTNAIVVSLRPLEELTVEAIMNVIENVLTSHEELNFVDGLKIDFGVITLPQGGRGRCHILNIDKAIDKKHCFVRIKNNDNMCMSRAIAVSWVKANIISTNEWDVMTQHLQHINSMSQKVLLVKKTTKSFYESVKRNNNRSQDILATEFCTLAGVNRHVPCVLSDISKFEVALSIGIYIASNSVGNRMMRVPNILEDETPQQPIYIYYRSPINNEGVGHYHAIVSITGFFNSSSFCTKCNKPYNDNKQHPCSVCRVCTSNTCVESMQMMSCKRCHMTCKSLDCFNRHQERKRVDDKSQCEQWWRCTHCKKVLQVLKFSPKQHKCDKKYCKSCDIMVDFQHLCHHRANDWKDSSKFRHLYFDFETRQDSNYECKDGYEFSPDKRCSKCTANEAQCTSCTTCKNCSDSICGLSEHIPNYAVLQKVCNLCENTPLCARCSICGDRQKTFSGETTKNTFCEYVINIRHQGYVCVAHNLRSFDGHFLLSYMIGHGLEPSDIIYSGSKIMFFTIKKLNMKFIDSLNFLPMALSALPKAFGLTTLKKGYFCHYFNKIENQNYVGPYPEKETYGINQMSTEGRKEFVQWHDMQTGIFNFQKELREYCISDVTILREACLTFRQLLMKVTQSKEGVTDNGSIDPFTHVTIAGVCMNIFKTKYFKEEYSLTLKNDVTEDTIQTTGFCKDNIWMYMLNNELVLATDTEYGIAEKQFVSSAIAQVPPHGYNSDQFSRSSICWLKWLEYTEDVEIQHALNAGEYCFKDSKYKADGYVPANDASQKPIAYFFHGCLWHGCKNCFPSGLHPFTGQSSRELRTLTYKMESFVKTAGYRVITIWECEYHDMLKNDAHMKQYVNGLDIQSRLNPRDSFFGGRTNAAKLYHKVSGDEKIKYVDFTSLYPFVNKYSSYPVGHPEVITTNFQDISQYFGIAKVQILPPRGLYHPVLPFRSDKLKFALCKTCSENETQKKCTCSDSNRAFIGTWCTPEIQKAVEKGYVILTIYEVYHWDNTSTYDSTSKSGGLFSEYINSFLKLKQEASGWPLWCKNDQDKELYIKNYHEKEGILLEAHKINKNPGLRSLAKLCLNSFWGKFGQRPDMSQTKFINSEQPHLFFSMLTDPQINVKDFYILSKDIIMLEYASLKQSMGPDPRSNVIIATFTTCWARLKLFDILDQLGERVLYYDTDSVIYVSKPGYFEPPTGDYLGELTDELNGEFITEYVSAGPKNYSYCTNTNNQICKV